ncbi:MAG: TenA family protein [Muribaculaceae bacterium]|nr:TenA family protein [Muribaculaceae bacterium]
MKKWSEEAWESSEDIYLAILSHPFIKELTDGSLPRECFDYYLRQDSLYLRQYFRVLAHIASRLTNIDFADTFIHFAADGVAVEKALHQSFLKDNPLSEEDMSPGCTLYTSVLLSQVLRPVEVEAAAILPCFWIYQKVGDHILASCRNIEDNPYKEWIRTYADPAFAESTRRAIGICDALAEKAAPEIRMEMTGIYRQCARMEWIFWDSAWNLEKWKI